MYNGSMVMVFKKFDIILVCSVTIVLVSSFCPCNRDKIETEKIGEMIKERVGVSARYGFKETRTCGTVKSNK